MLLPNLEPNVLAEREVVRTRNAIQFMIHVMIASIWTRVYVSFFQTVNGLRNRDLFRTVGRNVKIVFFSIVFLWRFDCFLCEKRICGQ